MTAQPDPAALRALVERIPEAIRATEYKYFGDYEMSDDQRAAVDTLVECAQALPQIIAKQDDERAADKARIGGADKRIRKLEAALRVARGYVLSNASEQSFRDQVTIDAALGIKP